MVDQGKYASNIMCILFHAEIKAVKSRFIILPIFQKERIIEFVAEFNSPILQLEQFFFLLIR